MRRALSLAVVFVLTACAGEDATRTPTTRPTIATVPPPAPPSPSVTLVDAGSAPVVEAEIDPSTVEGAARYLASTCAHAKAKDETWIVAHAVPALRGSTIVNEENGDTLLGWLAVDGVKTVPEAITRDHGTDGSACDVLALPASAIERFTSNGDHSSGVVRGPRAAYRFSIAKGTTTILEELTVDLPPHPMPKKAKKHAFDVEGNALHEAGTSASTIGPWIQSRIKHAPNCVYEAAAKDETSSVIVVHASKVDGTAAVVRLYASTVVSEALLACLEAQLQKEVADTFKGVPFDVDWLVRIMVSTTKPPGPNDFTVTMGPP